MSVAGPIGLKIREKRKRSGVTQADLANRAGISASYLNLIEADKRAIGGTLLRTIADELDVDVDELSGLKERRLVERLSEIATHPAMDADAPDPEGANALVSRHPDWARALLAVWRRYEEDEKHIAMLSDRRVQDPAVSEAIHGLLNDATAIRSTTEVLDSVEDLPQEQRERFIDIILSRSGALSRQAEHLVGLFDNTNRRGPSGQPAEEVDDFFLENHSWFPTLEVVADRLRGLIDGSPPYPTVQLLRALEKHHGVTWQNGNLSGHSEHAVTRYDPSGNQLFIATDAPAESLRFELASLLIRLSEPDCPQPLLDSDLLTSDEALERASRALIAWTAAALLLPYDDIREQARRHRYDIELLCGMQGVSFEQMSLRLVALRRQGDEGIPFGFLKIDPSGHVVKRYPLPGLPLPRSGAGCPLWPLYTAFQTPDRLVRQLSEFPNGSRYLQIARTLRQDTGGFLATPFLHAVMLTCDAAYADQMVYGDGLDLRRTGIAAAVGPACRLCSRSDCLHRGEESAVQTQKR